MWYLLIIFGVLSLLWIIMLYRNDRVFAYRIKLVEQISSANQADIARRRAYDGWRYTKFNEVSYEAMLYQFWKPLDSFYPDKSFLKENGLDPNQLNENGTKK